MNKIKDTYDRFLSLYGNQGWWPLLELHDSIKGTNPTKTGSINGYHPGNFAYPKNAKQRFEICVGAILTQNTNWPNVEKALLNLNKDRILDPEKIVKKDNRDLICELIRPAGYFNQKAKKLQIFAEFFLKLDGRVPAREELLSLWGIGPETADSILLYAYRVPTFVVDSYTRRLLIRKRLIDDKWSYDKIKELFEENLDKDYRIYQEYHALIVENAKREKK